MNSFTNIFKYNPPDFPTESKYKDIVKYLIDCQTASVRYYKLVICCGLIGISMSAVYTAILIHKNGWDILFDLKQYPSLLISILTLTFGQIEIESKKRELYNQIEKLSSENTKDESVEIYSEYKKWTWTEFQELFKTK